VAPIELLAKQCPEICPLHCANCLFIELIREQRGEGVKVERVGG